MTHSLKDSVGENVFDMAPQIRFAYLYSRISSLGQKGGFGIERQSDATKLQSLQDKRKVVLVDDATYQDIGVSARQGRNATHGALAQLRKHIGNKIPRGSELWIENVDRLSRQKPRLAYDLINELIKADIVIVTLSDETEYSKRTLDEQPWLIFQLWGSMQRAHDESQVKSDRIGDAWSRARRDAAQSGKKISSIAPAWLKAVRNDKGVITHFERIPERVDVVKETFTLAANGMGSWSIAKVLNDRKVPTFGTGKRWRSAIVSKIVSSKSVLGIYEPKKLLNGRYEPVDPIDGYYGEPIVDPVIWSRANTLRQGRDQTGAARQRRGKAVVNIFNEQCFCDDCGGIMRYKSYAGKVSKKGIKGKSRNYLYCESNMLGSGCKYVRKIRYDWLEETLLNHINVFPLEELFTDHSSNEEMQAIDAKIGTVTLKLDKLERDAAKAKRFMKDAETPEEEREWRRDHRDTLEQMKPVQGELAALRRKKSDLELALANRSDARVTIERLKAELDGADLGNRFVIRQKLSTMLKTFIDQIRFHEEFVTVILRGGLLNYRFSLSRPGGAPKKNPMKLLGDPIDLRPQLGDRVTGGISSEVFTSSPTTGKHDAGLQNVFDKLVNQEAKPMREKLEILIDEGEDNGDRILMLDGRVLSTHPVGTLRRWFKENAIKLKKTKGAAYMSPVFANDTQEMMFRMRWM